MLQAMREKYRQIRREVYNEATRPADGDRARHARNRAQLRDMVEGICNRADLDDFRAATPEARKALWWHLWTKNRYAGIKARTATAEIHSIAHVFDDYAAFSAPGWDIEANGRLLLSGGEHVQSFLNRSGPFVGTLAVGNIPKLKTIVTVAREFKRHADANPQAPALEFVTRGRHEDAVWDIHQDLVARGYRADLTALHFLMDVGFPVIKPDLVISRLFLDWGWLHHAAPGLPSRLSREDLLTTPKYQYFKPRIYKPIIDLAREIVQGIDRSDLEADIGWATRNPLREFDVFIVKAGQVAEPEYGIERRLYA